MQSHTIRFRVRYAETDQMGVVYHANYLPWFEMGRVEMCRSLGVRYRDMEANDGVLMVVAEVNVRYHAPARYDDEVCVTTSIANASTRLVEFHYEITEAETKHKLASGFTKHVFVNREMKPTRLPEQYRGLFGL
jgi:acyl-CoA thioester hydrolase